MDTLNISDVNKKSTPLEVFHKYFFSFHCPEALSVFPEPGSPSEAPIDVPDEVSAAGWPEEGSGSAATA
jgi:hypothetical protein